MNEAPIKQVELNASAPGSGQTSTQDLMRRICDRDNLNRAYKRVKSNAGAAGVDQMTIEALLPWLKTHGDTLINELQNGSYQPTAVKAVDIPKPQGGMRRLGIPTVVDRLVQQAILQVMQPILEPKFSDLSFGFRPGRSAHDALRTAESYVREGYKYVVDVDLEKFFDRVNHDMLMARLARHIADKTLLRLIRRFLTAGMMENGVVVRRDEGTPQGGPLSPLLANLLLTDLDHELERRKHKFCRYADDCNIYVKSQAAADRVLESVSSWIERKLKLRVNTEKSSASPCCERKFLGYRLTEEFLMIAEESKARLRRKLLELTRRRQGRSLEEIVRRVNELIRGWVQYFRLASCQSHHRKLDQWVRHRLRCIKLKQLKRCHSRQRFLVSLGVKAWQAWITCGSGKGLWRMSAAPSVHQAMNLKWFKDLGLLSAEEVYLRVRC